jgi:hypothetical protein
MENQNRQMQLCVIVFILGKFVRDGLSRQWYLSSDLSGVSKPILRSLVIAFVKNKKGDSCQEQVVYACNPSYSGSRDQEGGSQFEASPGK